MLKVAQWGLTNKVAPLPYGGLPWYAKIMGFYRLTIRRHPPPTDTHTYPHAKTNLLRAKFHLEEKEC